jgi:hypothetical protein
MALWQLRWQRWPACLGRRGAASRHPSSRVRFLGLVWGLVAGGLLTAAVVITLAFAAVESLLPAGGAIRPSRVRLTADLTVNVTLLANWCALYFGWQLIRERTTAEFRAVEAESLALKNELSRLQAQVSPHLLFNALNTVLACRCGWRYRPAATATGSRWGWPTWATGCGRERRRMITALLVDDEPRAFARLARLLGQSGVVDVIGTAASRLRDLLEPR